MSASDASSAIYVTDNAKQIKTKVCFSYINSIVAYIKCAVSDCKFGNWSDQQVIFWRKGYCRGTKKVWCQYWGENLSRSHIVSYSLNTFSIICKFSKVIGIVDWEAYMKLLQVDVAVKYLGFFLDDDKELERIKEVRVHYSSKLIITWNIVSSF